ncbi:MAG: hypothetical protein K0V04_18015 [Deltaproteobacteria bacterium]|nr:hypothetical protein [Deltaproteobacteria bacterium]
MRYRETTPLLLTMVLLAPACSDDDSSADGEAQASSGTAASEPSTGAATDDPAATDGSTGMVDSSGGGIDLDALYDCEDPDLFVAQPLSGPGIDPMTGELVEPLQTEYFVHTTQILVRPEQMETFFAVNGTVVDQLLTSEGLLGFSLALEPTCGFARTMAVWADERSMLMFVGTGAHLDAMTQVADLAITGRTTAWAAPAETMPLTWEMALAEIDTITPVAY